MPHVQMERLRERLESALTVAISRQVAAASAERGYADISYSPSERSWRRDAAQDALAEARSAAREVLAGYRIAGLHAPTARVDHSTIDDLQRLLGKLVAN